MTRDRVQVEFPAHWNGLVGTYGSRTATIRLRAVQDGRTKAEASAVPARTAAAVPLDPLDNGGNMTLTAIEPDEYPWFDYRGHTFCLGLQDGEAAWTSGQSSSVFDPASGRMKIEGDLGQQTELSYTKLLAVLAEAGLGATDVVHVTENVTAVGIPDYADAARVRESVFGSHRPTVSTVVVDRLVRSKALIEIELHAVPAGGVELAREGVLATFTAAPVREGHDGIVHLPTILPLNAEGEVVAPGDPVAQYEACLESVRTTLATAGLTSEQVVACHEYVTPAVKDALATLASTRASRLGDQTVGGTVVMERLHLDSVQVALDVTASRRPRQVVDADAPWCDGTPLVPAIRAGDALY